MGCGHGMYGGDPVRFRAEPIAVGWFPGQQPGRIPGWVGSIPTGGICGTRYVLRVTTGVLKRMLVAPGRINHVIHNGEPMARKPKPETADEIAARLTADTPRVPPIPPMDFVSTGCTMLNVALTGDHTRGIPRGTYLYVVGDSGSCKTWFTFCLFAEAARNRNFDGYRFIFDNAENGALMDVNTFFGSGVLPRLQPPRGTPDDPVYSRTVQEFYMNLAGAVKRGPCIYVLDSMDALEDDADAEKFNAELKFHETGKGESDIPGSMGMAKAKTNSRNINRMTQLLRDSGSMLVVISQTRDAPNSRIPGMKTRGGGRALRFYAHVELWTSVRGPITRTYLRREREIGSTIRIDVQKNRLNGWEGKIEVPFLKGYGVDDLGASVDFLITERHWGAPKTESARAVANRRGTRVVDEDDDDSDGAAGRKIYAPEFSFTGTREQLIKHIADAGDEWELGRIVADVWNSILAGARPWRPARYT